MREHCVENGRPGGEHRLVSPDDPSVDVYREVGEELLTEQPLVVLDQLLLRVGRLELQMQHTVYCLTAFW